ncbi:hypothetical protein OH77DRAFT_810302 [Trametes cingulata]|nr:hypothetical protein OH77DRAFT_810302 [Trametes cingulata]
MSQSTDEHEDENDAYSTLQVPGGFCRNQLVKYATILGFRATRHSRRKHIRPLRTLRQVSGLLPSDTARPLPPHPGRMRSAARYSSPCTALGTVIATASAGRRCSPPSAGYDLLPESQAHGDISRGRGCISLVPGVAQSERPSLRPLCPLRRPKAPWPSGGVYVRDQPDQGGPRAT